MKYLISMGSNMGDPAQILTNAWEHLSASPFLTVTGRSSFYKTPPWGKTDQEEFLNAVIEVEWAGEPEALLQLLLDTEASFGRIRDVHWGPRTLDLDLIYAGAIERNTEFLKLPHPFFWERLFVLVPLEEIHPEFTFRGQKIHERIKALGGYEGILKQEESWKGGNHDRDSAKDCERKD